MSTATENTSTEGATVEGSFTPKTLFKYNGHDMQEIYIAVKGVVYDVSAGRSFYGPSGPYANFAGHDASRGLALNSFDAECIRDFDQPIDDLKDLTPEDIDSLDGWEEHFQKKYPVVGTLVEN
ncbi:hypothetical protein BABINDRAFT_30132 [Babjeviella inositovora NRRL Y-12698]|uniref:Cytochrome b5 heme-binding domain-containing protein n=1 Tax=Babjeviella inositovora NRRL Y-12698 TaxID=984486 RepID=A0A1E3QZM2_9ASCO|nr:uncharacterized protein BABINDRAFT_30132 [Babjeviella inositovora NRRL Y-12698]ODQ82537.1 hypothetical protein BABINDRAFT_30132 [Babjeviella inositovora NRRL Y-12698]